jgi:hypothetical protein
MALQVRLPLSGDTTNYGLNGTDATTLGTMMYASGILGGKSFNAGDGTVVVSLDEVPSKFTLAMWFSGESAPSNSTMLAFGSTGARIDIATDTLNYKFTGSASGLVENDTNLFRVNDRTWNHLVITASGTEVKVYLNGVLNGSFTQANSVATVFGTDNTIYIGSKADGTNAWNGFIENFMFYDNIISQREISELAKGIVLEYTFNHNGFGNENLLQGSDDSMIVSGSEKINRKEDKHFYAELEAGTYTLSAITSGIWSESNNASTGATIVASDSSTFPTSLEIYTVDDNGDIDTRIFYNMTKGYATVTITTPGRYYVGGIVYGNGVDEVVATFDQLKIEKGTKSTIWCPTRGSEYYNWLEIGKVEQDTSGNKLDAAISDPEPIWSNDSRLYSGSYDFSNNAYIASPVIDVTNLDHFTVSIWAKAANMSNKVLFGFDTDPKFNFSTIGGVFGIYDVENNTQIPFGDGVDVSTYVSEWHQYTITGDGTTEKLYIDGEFVGNASKYIAFGLSKLYVNGWDATTSYNFNGLLSDIRIYATTFTADAVKSLYSTRLAVDNTGKLYGIEFIAGMDELSSAKAQAPIISIPVMGSEEPSPVKIEVEEAFDTDTGTAYNAEFVDTTSGGIYGASKESSPAVYGDGEETPANGASTSANKTLKFTKSGIVESSKLTVFNTDITDTSTTTDDATALTLSAGVVKAVDVIEM